MNYTALDFAGDILDSLGSPCAQAFRFSLKPEDVQNYAISMMLSHDSEIQGRIRELLGRTASYEGQSSFPAALGNNATSGPSPLWLTCYFGNWSTPGEDEITISKRKIAAKVLPGPCDPTWASLGRVSLWDSLYSKDNPVAVSYTHLSSALKSGSLVEPLTFRIK